MTKMIKKTMMVLALPGMLAGSLLVADTLSLKSGETMVGTFSSGNQNEIVFNTNGQMRRFSMRDVRSIEFAPLPTASWPNASSSNGPWNNGPGNQRRWRVVDNSWVHFAYPANWQIADQGDLIRVTSPGYSGRFRNAQGFEGAITIGMHREWNSSTQGLRGRALEAETNQILADLGGQMRNVQRTGPSQPFQLDGQRALRTPFTSGDNRGGADQNWLITAMHPQGVLYMVFNGSAADFPNMEEVFEQMQNTVRIGR